LAALWERPPADHRLCHAQRLESVYLSTRIAVMSRAAGRIAADLKVDLLQPRSHATRMSADYAAMCEAVSASLAQAMGPSP